MRVVGFFLRQTSPVEDLPEITARMYNPVSDCSLPHFLSHQSVFVSEQFHREFVVGHLEERDDLVLEIVGRRDGRRARRLYDGVGRLPHLRRRRW